jgi:S-adenosylmethionine-diacylglycerol 3-amino-3-carboxypropyl transferase
VTAPLSRATSSEVETAIADGSLRYSSVWEDHRLLEQALTIRESNVLIIASAGCNVLNVLLRAPRRVVALDFNPAQTALVELKLAAIGALSHREFLALLGVRESYDRLDLYDRVRPAMSEPARDWWDTHVGVIENGVECAGRLDRYIAEFRTHHLPRVHSPEVIDRLFTIDERDERRRYASEAVFTPEFENVFRRYFTRESLAGRGRDDAQFRYVNDVDVGGWFWERLQWVATELPTRDNVYLERFLRGGVRDIEAGPPYLRPSNFARLRSLVDRVEVVTDSLEEYLGAAAPRAFDAAALSDVFEYMSDDSSERLFTQLGDVLQPGGRIAFWNLFVPRSPIAGRSRFQPLRTLSRDLWRRDRSWFYRAFHVAEVLA